MDIGSRLLVVKAAPGDAERELTKASRGDRRNDVVNRDESSEITMNLRTSISSKELLHLLTELIYFVLYMHQQMPCTYEELKNCCKEQTEAVVARSSGAGDSSNPALRGRQRREEASNLRKLVKLKDQIEKVVRALKSSLTSLSDIRSVLVILGPSPMRPKHVYEVHLRCQVNDVGDDTVEDRPKSSDLARKLIRALISDGATSSAESSMKLFLVIGASANPISVPEDVHPKRGLVISRKQGSRTSVRLVQQRETNLEAEVSSICLSDPSPSTSDDDDSNESLCDNDYMWYQCLHTVKGLFEGNLAEAA
ncbi:hypothetical protein Mapa_014582 [Marchantia paleacea]|nr:hypothetical protein Mapa_014582 [Marchantia paleacea]